MDILSDCEVVSHLLHPKIDPGYGPAKSMHEKPLSMQASEGRTGYINFRYIDAIVIILVKKTRNCKSSFQLSCQVFFSSKLNDTEVIKFLQTSFLI